MIRLIFFLCFILQTPLYAETLSTDVAFPISSYLKTLTFVIFILVLLLLFLKRMRASGTKLGNTVGLVEVLDRIQLEPQLALYIIRIKTKIWLVSAGSKSANKIADISDLIDAEDLIETLPLSFKDALNSILKTKKHESSDMENSIEY